MFKLIKWIILLGIFIGLWYGATLFFSLEKNEKEQLKKDAQTAMDSGNTEILIKPLEQKVKEDLLHKKARVLDILKERLKDQVDKLFEWD